MPESKSRSHTVIKVVLILVVLLALAVIGVIIGVRRYYYNNLRPVSSSEELIEVTIPEGYTLPDISRLLNEKRLIRNVRVFEQYVRNNGAAKDIKAGTYELSPSHSVPEIVAIITEGKIASDLVTIAPGIRIDQVKKTLKNAGYSDQDIDQALDPATYPNHPALVDKPKDASLEGYLYPDSFQRISTTPATDIIRLSLDEMNKRLTPNLREAFTAQGLSVHKAIILASIIEREVSSTDDRHQVAQVFLKRLRMGMKLQSDATAKYGAVLDGRVDLGYAETLSYSSAYNTYEQSGLPPGPISNVSESSLNAVASPAATDWLYFVSGDDGNTYFSKTLAEHQTLTKLHCKTLCGN